MLWFYSWLNNQRNHDCLNSSHAIALWWWQPFLWNLKTRSISFNKWFLKLSDRLNLFDWQSIKDLFHQQSFELKFLQALKVIKPFILMLISLIWNLKDLLLKKLNQQYNSEDWLVTINDLHRLSNMLINSI